jgi:hypothetical protein
MKSNRLVFLAGGGLAFIALLVFGIARLFGPPVAARDSPITVVGGSIHALSKQTWKLVSADEYSTTLPDNFLVDQIVSEHVTHVANLTQVQNGWVVMLANRNNGSAVEICSDAQCSYLPVENQIIYAKLLLPNTAWEVSTTAELHYHDYSSGCDRPTDPKEGSCDYLSKVTIGDVSHKIPPSNSSAKPLASGECRAFVLWGGHCSVGIGKP